MEGLSMLSETKREGLCMGVERGIAKERPWNRSAQEMF
jgi:hypothetical protein